MASRLCFDAELFGNTVRYYRERAGLSQRQLAQEVGIRSSYMCRIESGKRVPSLEVAVLLGDALGMDTAIELVDAMIGPGRQPALSGTALDVARFMRDPEVSQHLRDAVARSIEVQLRVR